MQACYATTRIPRRKVISRFSLTTIHEDRAESIKKRPNDSLQYKLYINQFNELVKDYRAEYEVVAKYFCEFSLHDRCRILRDIQGFPEYIEATVTDFLCPREISAETQLMFGHMRTNWKIIHDRLRLNTTDPLNTKNLSPECLDELTTGTNRKFRKLEERLLLILCQVTVLRTDQPDSMLDSRGMSLFDSTRTNEQLTLN